MTREEVVKKIFEEAEKMYLSTGRISQHDEKYAELISTACEIGVTSKEVFDVESEVLNRHYFRPESREYIPDGIVAILAA